MNRMHGLRSPLVVAFAASLSIGFAGPDSPVPDDAVPPIAETRGPASLTRPVNPRAPRPQSASIPAPDRDGDGDGFADQGDNCPEVPNDGQRDLDGDGIGDACDDDIDGDGVANAIDTCPQIPNCNQRDMDGDGIGDVCDADADGDGIANWDDPYAFDPRSSSSINASTGRAKHMIDQALMKSILTRVMTVENWTPNRRESAVTVRGATQPEEAVMVTPPIRRKVTEPARGRVARARDKSPDNDRWDETSWESGENADAAPAMGSLRSGSFSQPEALLNEL